MALDMLPSSAGVPVVDPFLFFALAFDSQIFPAFGLVGKFLMNNNLSY